MDVSRRTVLKGTVTAGLGIAAAGISPAISSASDASRIEHIVPYALPVTIGGVRTRVTGRLHRPAGTARGLIIGVHGFTYAGYYWDFPHPGNNFATALTNQGWAVLALNLPGAEPSTGYPDPGVLTIASLAEAVRLVVADVRKDTWRRVILAGHSMGSSVALEAAGSGGIGGLILSGFTHAPSAAGTALAEQSVIPAPGLPSGYITTAAPGRAAVFLQTGVSPDVIALDEKLKTSGSATELATLPTSFDPAISRALSLPVLIANGEFDLLYYGPGVTGTVAGTLAEEKPFWTRPLDVVVLAGAPHCLNLARNAGAWFEVAARFANQVAR